MIKELYEKLWKEDYTKSQCAKPLAKYIMETANRDDVLLDMGCGDGTTVRILREHGFEAYGVDITLAGAMKKIGTEGMPLWFYESPLHDLSIFETNKFDYTFSTDVLEHLEPERLPAAIQEILRITKTRTFHCMPKWGDNRNGVELHLIQQDPAWWAEQFRSVNHKGIEVITIERETFLKENR